MSRFSETHACILEHLEIYKSRPFEQLKQIQPKWAYGKDVNRLLDEIQNPINNEYTIFIVDTTELILKSNLYEVNPNILFTGGSTNDFRITRILYRWEKKKFVDPPCIGLDTLIKDKINFVDGRHRTKLTYLLGHRQIPVAIGNFQIQTISKIIKLANS